MLAVYLAFFLTLAGIGFLLANPISDQVRTFANNLPHIVDQFNKKLETFQGELNQHGLHVQIVKPGKTALQSIQDKVAKEADKLVSFGGALATEVANGVFDLLLVFVLSVYMLLYGRQIGALVRRAMPDGDGTSADDYPHLVQRAVSRYIGGQLLFSTVIGASTGLALYLFGVIGIFPDGRKYALAFAVFYGVMELVPTSARSWARSQRCSWRCSPIRSRRCGWRCCSSACSSSRATWWHHRCSGTRCGSIRCS